MTFVFKHPSKYKKFKTINVNTVATNTTKVKPKINTVNSLKQNKKTKE